MPLSQDFKVVLGKLEYRHQHTIFEIVSYNYGQGVISYIIIKLCKIECGKSTKPGVSNMLFGTVLKL